MIDTILFSLLRHSEIVFSTMSTFKKLVDKIQECVASEVFYLE